MLQPPDLSNVTLANKDETHLVLKHLLVDTEVGVGVEVVVLAVREKLQKCICRVQIKIILVFQCSNDILVNPPGHLLGLEKLQLLHIFHHGFNDLKYSHGNGLSVAE